MSIYTLNAQVPQKALVEHFTNTNCGICASRNPGLYANYQKQTNVFYLSIHPSSPYASCLLSKQNKEANDARTKYYDVYGGTPVMLINGTEVNGNFGAPSIYTPYINKTSPASIQIEQQKLNNDLIVSKITIKTVASHTLGKLSLFVALAEDTVTYKGGNGEPKHFNVMRKSLTSPTGDAFTLPQTIGDSIVLNYSSTSNVVWDFSRIFTFAVLQESDTKKLVQAETISPKVVKFTTKTNDQVNEDNYKIYPNPVYNTLIFDLPNNESVSVTVLNFLGQIVIKQEVNSSSNSIDVAQLGEGNYILSIKTNKGRIFKKIIKI